MRKYSINENLIVKEIDKKSVLVNINTAKYYTFNETGDFILKCLLEKMNYEDTKAKFLESFYVEEDVFEKAYKDFIEALKTKNIILKKEEDNEKKAQ
ncbi:MAG: PqqD family protein [Deltaproteobacteria bacterium]|nr:PqqD family protein [Deltaproteobacteria bacterium]